MQPGINGFLATLFETNPGGLTGAAALGELFNPAPSLAALFEYVIDQLNAPNPQTLYGEGGAAGTPTTPF